ncbi:cytochrome P450 [Coniella lustricola]|uniref:Cytochrome P450 n=1 Tax=Coniella lustricola TaxID=2025994 RepID=A0A2T3A260_9PEZI|nr:cytochrome P450 [Coniella lustricola]
MSPFDIFANSHLSSLSITNLVLGYMGLIVIWLIATGFTGPLTRLPGPLWSKWTDLPVRYYLLKGDKAKFTHSLHETYGPVVRTGPKTVYISDVATVRAIYAARSTSFLKDPSFYVGGNIRSVFSALDPRFHAQRRRILGPCFAEIALEDLQPTVMNRAQLCISQMGRDIKTRGYTDILHWWTLFAMDVISEMCFGESFHMLEDGKKNQYAQDIAEMGALLPLRGAFPWLIWLGQHVPFFPWFKNVGITRQRVVQYGQKHTSNYMKLVQSEDRVVKKTLFASIIQKGGQGTTTTCGDGCGDQADRELLLTAQDVAAESQSYITAGTDTTAITMTYLVYAVVSNSQIQQRLLDELHTLPDNFTNRDLRELKFLNMLLDETLRLHGASQGGLPRVVPAGGANLAGHFIPGGCIVAAQNYSVHRDQDVFPEPEKFNPWRWENPSKEMMSAYMPFAIGPRNCIGLNLAKMELRLCTALFFRAFPSARLSTKKGMSHEDMEKHVNFLVSPKGHRCLIEV